VVLSVTGSFIQALDALTPLGRGQALLVTGEQHSGKSSAVLDAILGQYGSGVRCIYAAIGQRCPPLCILTAWRCLELAQIMRQLTAAAAQQTKLSILCIVDRYKLQQECNDECTGA